MFKKSLLLMIVCFTMSCATGNKHTLSGLLESHLRDAEIQVDKYDIMKDTKHVIVSYQLHDIHGGAPETRVLKERAFAVLPNVVITWLDKEYAMTALNTNGDGVYNGRRAMYFATSVSFVMKVYIIAEDQEPLDVKEIPERVQEAMPSVVHMLNASGGIDAVIKQEVKERTAVVNKADEFNKQVDDLMKILPPVHAR